jgi:cytochrome P450 family 110
MTTTIPRDMLPPGPTLHPIIQGLRYGLRPVPFLEECARRYGDCFTLRLPVGAVGAFVYVSAPAAVRQVFTGDPESVRAGEANGILKPLLGAHSLLLLDGARHMRERRLLLPPFHGERMLAYGEPMRRIVDRMIDGWQPGTVLAMHPAMQRTTLDVILATVFGVDEGPDLDELRACLMRWIRLTLNPLWLWPRLQVDAGPLSPWGRFVRARHAVDRRLAALIAHRRATGADHGTDVLSMLIAARDDEGRALGDEELRDHLVTLLLAGHETTATALAWAFHLVLAHPAVHARLRTELQEVVGTAPVQPEHVGRLEYLDAIVKEALRLHPVIPDVGRVLARPMRIGAWDLPAGVAVTPCIHLTHHRPDVWPEPARFRPERFLGGRVDPYAFLPFGGGTRRCLGMAFALYEMKVVLAEVLLRVALRPLPGYEPRLVRRSVTVAPSQGMPLVVERRAA